MELEITKDALPVYEALASNVRIEILQLLAKKKMNIRDLADTLNLSSAITTKHIQKLEKAQLIKTERIGHQKICSLRVERVVINFPKQLFSTYSIKETSIPIGHYTDYSVEPTCGLASAQQFIGPVDQPKYFIVPERMDAQIVWFTKGFLEYKSPNLLDDDEKLTMMEISFEISSEFPFANDNWPSDITFSLNDIELGTWTSPGDFADIRGKYTPDWYPDNLNQYGLLKTIRIMSHGTYIDGDCISQFAISDVDSSVDTWKFKVEVKASAKNVGGCTLFGKAFGNYDQDIKIKLFYN
ncbi:ArsR/SmtB family transcription factor [Streptococcus ovuberis]|uniref:Helix-turn-helix domain-containing protein n=1 Tax=Streptococcus ovuberis TaxID=1936207 RepID=A0A7X6S0G3_9STRE|nr:ArsR family transcriptional regulator [Streptococcus ovuberis]NKZ19295.1 helix-turn-helix domain-containing protein [Streptococcus ovuberis]